MKLIYDPEADILTIQFQPGVKWAETDEIGKWIMADFDAEGDIVQLEVLFAKDRLESLTSLPIHAPDYSDVLPLSDAAE